MLRPAMHRFTLCAALLIAVPALAAAKDRTPVPDKPPTRVPFSAFRTKPILDRHSEEGKLKSNGKKPIKVKLQPRAKPAPPQEAQAQEEPQERETLEPATVQIVGGAPIPARKPGVATPDEIIAMPATAPHPEETAEPAPDDQAEQAEEQAVADAEAQADETITPFAPPPKPSLLASALNIRPSRREKERTAGAGFGERSLQIASFAAHELKAMLSPDANGDISPVLLPGYTEVVAAPDAPGEDASGLPAQVIVFFQDSSPKMEIGQLDVVNADVLERMRARPDLHLEIVGFSEKLEGEDDATLKMAAIRAAELRDYLKSHQIDSDRLTVTAKGDDTEIEPRDRVEMHFTLVR